MYSKFWRISLDYVLFLPQASFSGSRRQGCFRKMSEVPPLWHRVFFMFGSEGVRTHQWPPSLPRPLRPHLLLLGDPGTGKSQLLQELNGGTPPWWESTRNPPGSVTKKSPLLKSDRIPFKEAGESLEKPSIFQGRCLLNFRDVCLLMDVVVVIVCMFCMKHVFILVKICFFIHWSLRFFMGLRYCC